MSEWLESQVTRTVWELQQDGVLLVEDGNHGEYRPLPHEFIEQGVAFIRAADMTDDGRVLFETASRINSEARARIRKGVGRGGDVLLSHKGTVGRVALAPLDAPDYVCSPQTTFWRVLRLDLIDRRYLYYYLRTHEFKNQLNRVQFETDMAGYVSLTNQRRLKVPLPPLPVQREIAHILGTLDDKIDLNRKMNATLEAMARALFKSWFVDFDPVRAKAEGRDPAGMDAETAALFPDAFEDSPLGDIPRGWRVMPLDEIANYRNGLALQKYPPTGNDYLPVIKIRELRQGYVDSSSDKASPNIIAECIVEDGDVLFSWSGSLLVDFWTGGRGALNQHLFKVTSREYPKWLYYLWTHRHLDAFIATAADKATTMGHIQRRHLSEALCVVPHFEDLQVLNRVFEPIFEQLIALRLESRTLAEMRDALLPRLMRGELVGV